MEMSKASAELSEASKESKEIGRIVKGDWQNCQSSCEIIKVSAQRMCTRIYICSKITQTGISPNNLEAAKSYFEPQERKRHSTNIVQ